MRVWLTRSSFLADPCIEVWLKKPKLYRPITGEPLFVNSAGHFDPDYDICLKVFRKLTGVRLKPNECRCVDLRLSIKPIVAKRKVMRK